jgi:hypothetical protein
MNKCKHYNITTEEWNATVTHSYKYDPKTKRVEEKYEGCEFNDGERQIICNDCGEELKSLEWFDNYDY